ncbi:hypothetical protein HZ326_23405 [Fusarium oxysporum f. sp. albedinis]|nr:hypothetical protein HZ326_23405 [Fusarium oxysporum f. sp. albedinis]
MYNLNSNMSFTDDSLASESSSQCALVNTPSNQPGVISHHSVSNILIQRLLIVTHRPQRQEPQWLASYRRNSIGDRSGIGSGVPQIKVDRCMTQLQEPHLFYRRLPISQTSLYVNIHSQS